MELLILHYFWFHSHFIRFFAKSVKQITNKTTLQSYDFFWILVNCVQWWVNWDGWFVSFVYMSRVSDTARNCCGISNPHTNSVGLIRFYVSLSKHPPVVCSPFHRQFKKHNKFLLLQKKRKIFSLPLVYYAWFCKTHRKQWIKKLYATFILQTAEKNLSLHSKKLTLCKL